MRARLFASLFSGLFASALAVVALFAPTSAAAQDDVGSAVEGICCGVNCCLIGGSCSSRGDANPSNPCQTCNPSMSQTAWTDTAGCGGTDSGPPPARDAGTGTTDGGGCSAATGTGSAAQAGLLGLLGALFLVRRRR